MLVRKLNSGNSRNILPRVEIKRFTHTHNLNIYIFLIQEDEAHSPVTSYLLLLQQIKN